ncbi:winged helix-turn-helix domain-containing protein [Spongiactinospora sp. TRM90649]|uniref:winged helix-turn-helix domain-containing protein n=1 Tax=Spongiactinospora sp. TRM90649 TaxID=3031114 RepID=UPI0023F76D05|nr:winged helix-turn-helix domain-containing protein [Spongiactinospora sp. TRM90649]MDF5758737.1 winged helix-turn-helix domain-containing protein [Spongiactinospora sp. TRM90649]
MHSTILIQMAASPTADRPYSLELGPGERAHFGRGTPGSPVDIPLDDPAVSRRAGEITAVGDYWLLSNLNTAKTYVVDNPEGGGEFVKVPPGRMGAPIPFEFSRVSLPAVDGTVSFLVFAPQHRHALPGSADRSGAATQVAYPLDQNAKYFRILVALCEPRLRDPASSRIPTIPEIMDRLPGLGLSRTAIGFHIGYLAEKKLHVKRPQDGDGKADWQRHALVSLALRFDLVTSEHLALLPVPGR